MNDPNREFLRHTLATLAYRAAKTIRDAPADFSGFRAAAASRSAGEILAHIGDLLDWALCLAKGLDEWRDSQPLPWNREAARFFAGIEAFNAYLASGEPLGFPAERLFQGPVADALTHVGQIAMLRRLAAAPVRGENYFRAGIAAGRLGPEQAAPVKEFE